MSNFSYIPFTITDHTGVPSLSSYNLLETPLTFIPDLRNINTPRVLWTFGDGTTSTSLTAKKGYTESGTYNVNLIVYDCFSKAQISTSSQTIKIKNYIDDTFTIDLSSNIWKNGKINGPLKIKRYVPHTKNLESIFFDVLSSDSVNFQLVKDEKYSHLIPTYQFFEKIYNYAIKSDQYSNIDRINFDSYDTIYAKISGYDIVPCSAADDGAFIVGLSATKDVFFKDDLVSDKIEIDFFVNRKDKKYNNLATTLSATIIENDEVSKLSITSTGLDGEFYEISSFNIDDTKFYNTVIPFIIKIKDYEHFSVKNFPISSFQIEVLSGDNILSSSNYTLSTIEAGMGYYFGALKFNIKDFVSEGIKISAQQTLVNDQGNSHYLSGHSNIFNIYPNDYYQIEKINEDFDMTETIKSLRFQEILLDKHVLFDDFIRTVLGDIDSPYDTLGKSVHEKITNFFMNHQDIDRCDVNSLVSMMTMLGMDSNTFESSNLKYPEKIKRFVNLFSVQPCKLFGTPNKFSENFNPRGRISKDEYGKNLGDIIDATTYTVSANIPIVAYEKFSKDYSILNTYQPLSSTGSFTYPLSAYTEDWGWNLVLPDAYDIQEILKFYEFYEYIPGEEGNIVGNVVTNECGQYFDITLKDNLNQALQLNK
jgi:hypothetical protein